MNLSIYSDVVEKYADHSVTSGKLGKCVVKVPRIGDVKPTQVYYKNSKIGDDLLIGEIHKLKKIGCYRGNWYYIIQ